MIAGVCGGIAEWLGWDPTIVRILYVVVSCVSVAFPGILAYIVLWLIMPNAPMLISGVRTTAVRRVSPGSRTSIPLSACPASAG